MGNRRSRSFDLPIILASTSPRRIDLLRQIGLSATVMAPVADETPLRGEAPRALVNRLSRAKATSLVAPVLTKYAGALIIAADTIVVSPDGKKVLGKPTHAANARKMLAQLSGRTHTVLTGYCLLHVSAEHRPKFFLRVVSSRVKMRKLSPQAVQRYVASGEPMDKAGAYAAQGMGMTLIEQINGSYTNVVGLPIAQLIADIETQFGLELLSWTL